MNIVFYETDGSHWVRSSEGYRCRLDLTLTDAELATLTSSEASFKDFMLRAIPSALAGAILNTGLPRA